MDRNWQQLTLAHPSLARPAGLPRPPGAGWSLPALPNSAGCRKCPQEASGCRGRVVRHRPTCNLTSRGHGPSQSCIFAGNIFCTSNPSNGAYSSGTLKHFFNSDLHNSSASSERFSNPLVLSVGRGVTDRSCGDRSAALDASFHAQHYPAKSMLGEEDTIFKLDYSNISIITL